jgi:hypothetical protein
MFSLGIMFILGLVGLVVDTGYGYYLKQVMQTTADTAAMAAGKMAMDNGFTCGTSGVVCSSGTSCPVAPNNPPVTTTDEACLYGQKHSGATITIASGTGSPPSNSGVTPNYWMTVTATQSYPLTFMQVLGFRTATVTASATSGVLSSGAAGGCFWVLDPNGSAAFNATGTTNVQSNCTIFVNSSAPDGFTAKGGAVINVSGIDVVGGASIDNNATVHPTPTTGASSAADPLAWVPDVVVPSGCDFTGLHITNGNTHLHPGNYCGGIQVSSGGKVTFDAGNYYLVGGGLQVTSSNATLSGTGVTFLNTANAAYAFNAITIAGGANINLTAPLDNTNGFKGILMYQDRNIVSSATTAIGGGGNEYYQGSIYIPTGNLQYSGGSSTQQLTLALIAKDLTIVGNAYLQKDGSGGKTGIPPNVLALVQ